MSTIAILYATREGHTRKIADHLAARLRSGGNTAEIVNVRSLPKTFDLRRYDGAILAASVHAAKHEPEMTEFVRRRRSTLTRVPTAFLSVSLSETTAEDSHADATARAKASAEVQKVLDGFFRETGFLPTRAKPIAGALVYTQYGLFKRLLMQFISRRSGGPTDTSRDYEFTDWEALDHFADEFAHGLRSGGRPDETRTHA